MGLNIKLNEQLKKVLEHNARNELKMSRFMGNVIYCGKEDEQDKRREVNEQPEQHSQDKKTEELNDSDQ